MVVPFLILLASSTTNAYDYDRFKPIPRYFWSTQDRFMKGLVYFFNAGPGWHTQLRSYYPDAPSSWTSWRLISADSDACNGLADYYINPTDAQFKRWEIIAEDYSHFVDQYSIIDTTHPINELQATKYLLRKFGNLYRQQYPDKGKKLSSGKLRQKALLLVSQRWGNPFESFYDTNFGNEYSKQPIWQYSWFPPITPRYEDYLQYLTACRNHMFTPGIRSKWLRYLNEQHFSFPEDQIFPVNGNTEPEIIAHWQRFKADVAPASPVVPFSHRVIWYKFLKSEDALLLAELDESQEFDISVYNRLAGTNYHSLFRTPFPIPKKFAPGIQKLWRNFVETRYPIRLTTIKLTNKRRNEWIQFLKKRFPSLEVANRLLGTKNKKWSDFELSETPPEGERVEDMRILWADFIKSLPAEDRILQSSEIGFQEYLLKKYNSVETVNRIYGWSLDFIEEAYPPFDVAYAITFKNNETAFWLEPILSNYKEIIDYILTHVNALPVTFVLVVLAVTFALTVNPIAAYALSRFNLRGQSQILLFMLATMAFPAMVSAIPAYLLMRDLNLLNTFFALVLPAAANGMAIFILKGFFDGLPAELYEAATIDGAKEWQIFLWITMPMVKPILAITALFAFTNAYNGWQWALIICQDKKMWTLAVWMYQASQRWASTPWIVMAGFVIVSIPTLLVFLFCQKIILRGIILPSMK